MTGGESSPEHTEGRYDESMRTRVLLPFLVLTAVVFVLPDAALAQAKIPFFGPIIPDAIRTCPSSFAMVIEVINNIILFSITIVITVVAPLMIAYAGFLMVVNPFNAGGIGRARSIMLNLVVGVVIALAGWLIVSAVMAVLYNPGNAWPTWYSIINSGGLDPCLKQAGSQGGLLQAPTIVGTSAAGVNTLAFGSGACSADVVRAGAQAGGHSLTEREANTLACLAQPESSCGAKLKNYAWDTGTPGKPGSTAAGAFQVLLSTHSDCYENQACYQATGVSRLNCSTGFTNGNPKKDASGKEVPIVGTCLKAAANTACSAAAAACVLKKQGFSAWTKDPRSVTGQNICIATYSN